MLRVFAAASTCVEYADGTLTRAPADLALRCLTCWVRAQPV